MEPGYGQFIYLDESNFCIENECTTNTSIVVEKHNKIKSYLLLKSSFNGSILVMFLQYVCNLVEYFYKK